jgi:hypothetical protein
VLPAVTSAVAPPVVSDPPLQLTPRSVLAVIPVAAPARQRTCPLPLKTSGPVSWVPIVPGVVCCSLLADAVSVHAVPEVVPVESA